MSALTTRDALAKALYDEKIGGRYYMERADAEEIADTLLASGVVVDAATLADDDGSLAHITACLAYPLRGDFEADQVRLPHERVQHILRVLPAALSERSSR